MRTRPRTSSHTRRWVIAAFLAAGVVAMHGIAAFAQTETPGQTVTVEVEQARATVDPEGALDFTVTTQVTTVTAYLETRLQVFNPGGSLLYQKTEVRNDVEAGSTAIRFSRELDDLDLSEGRYPATIRVLATGAEPTYVEDRMLLIDDDREALPVSLIVRVACAPARDPEGRFVIDPAASARHRDEIIDALALARPGRPLSAALPPIMLEDWLLAAGGYSTVGPEGVVTVDEAEPVPSGYSAALARLSGIARGDSVELLDVPYAEPDLQGLQAMEALDDLLEHYRAGRTVYRVSIEATPVAGTAITGDSIGVGAIPVLEERELGFVLLSPTATANVTTPSAGVHPIEGSTLDGLLVDAAAGEALDDGDCARLVDRLFDAARDDEDATVIVQTTLGPGAPGSVEDLSTCLEHLGAIPWVELLPVSDAERSAEAEPVTLLEQAEQGAQAPLGYWGEVLESRRMTVALRAAAGERDPDVERALTGILTAESRCWAGPDGGWGLADRGRAYAAAAGRGAGSILAAVTISSEDITLAGRTGKVPLSIANGSSKPLTVTVVARGERAAIDPPEGLEVALRPAENFVTLSVSMRSALTDQLKVDVMAGDTVITTTDVRVRASYLDRLTIAGSVVLVLAVLLFYIRRRVMT